MKVERAFGSKELGKDDFFTTLRKVWLPLLKELLRNFNGLQASTEFIDGTSPEPAVWEMVGGILFYRHNLGSLIVDITLIDTFGIIRTDIPASGFCAIADENTVAVNLNAYSVTGTWRIMVRRD